MITNLPTELRREICEWLYKIYPASILDFSLASRDCYAAAVEILFRTIHIHFSGFGQLSRQVAQCRERLQREQRGFSVVHRLIVTGYGYYYDDDTLTVVSDGTGSGRPWQRLGIRAPERAPDDDTDLDRWLDQQDVDHQQTSNEPLEVVYENDHKWLPLAHLVEQMPALNDIVYGCDNQIPPCLLDLIHGKLPGCKLRMSTFRLRSLYAPFLDDHEYRLVTSPNLYSIQCAQEIRFGSHYGTEPQVSTDVCLREIEAAVAALSGLAPGVKQARLLCDGDFRDSQSQPESFSLPREKIIRRVKESTKLTPGSMGSLQYLQLTDLTGDGSCMSQLLLDSSRNTDLSVLRALRLEMTIPTRTLWDLDLKYSFPALTTFVLSMWPVKGQSHDGEPPLDSSAVSPFVQKLVRQGLTVLQLDGWDYRASSPTSILGPSLKVLRLTSQSRRGTSGALLQKDVEHLAELCPSIEELALPIWRSQGDAREVAMYTALGRLGRLRRLSLLFLVWVPTRGLPVPPSNNEFESRELSCLAPYRVGHLRDAIIDAAVDEKLARAIFHTIRARNRPSHPSLQYLQLDVAGWQEFCGRESMVLDKYFLHIGLSWLLNWDPRDTHHDKLLAQELGRDERLANAKMDDENSQRTIVSSNRFIVHCGHITREMTARQAKPLKDCWNPVFWKMGGGAIGIAFRCIQIILEAQDTLPVVASSLRRHSSFRQFPFSSPNCDNKPNAYNL